MGDKLKVIELFMRVKPLSLTQIKMFMLALNYHTPLVIHNLKRIPTKQELFESFKSQRRQL